VREEDLIALADRVTRETGATACPVRITGKRRALIGRTPPCGLPLATPRTVLIGDGAGLVVYGWEDLKPDVRRRLEELCREARNHA
jgi:hypothetical protein